MNKLRDGAPAEELEFGKWVGLGYTADFYDGAAQAWGEQAKRKASLREQLSQAQREIERLQDLIAKMLACSTGTKES